MPSAPSFFWKTAPFFRLLIPFSAGILLSWYTSLPVALWALASALSGICFAFFFMLNKFSCLQYRIVNGLLIHLLLISAGALVCRNQDIRHQKNWIGNLSQPTQPLILRLTEDPMEKANSFKAIAEARYLCYNQRQIPVQGKIILYFSKDSATALLHNGTCILLHQPLQRITSTGNPGSFDYQRYCLFQQLTHQGYLKSNEYTIVQQNTPDALSVFIDRIRSRVLLTIRNNISGEKEKGLAEALLIGYKEDLDKDLVQSYTNTGVVHIIAISGLHLGLVYWLLVLLSKSFHRNKNFRWLKPVIIISGLWIFTLLAGAQSSVLRSAVMFTCVVLGETICRKPVVLNSLAASAFLLLCYQPFWLWDAGFQLSYAAVLSLVIFMQPVYNWFFIRNKLLDLIWKMNAVTIAAQILTLPLTIYHFHQFPDYFLLTNLIAVPLSSLIVLAEIALCAIYFINPLAQLAGKILSALIWLMNACIQRIEVLPFSLWNGLSITILQAVLLMAVIAAVSYWLLQRQRLGLVLALGGLCCFAMCRSISMTIAENQQRIIVYNVPQKQAIDLIDGRWFHFIGDSTLMHDGSAKNYHLNPARVLYRVSSSVDPIHPSSWNRFFCFAGKRVLLLDQWHAPPATGKKIRVDLVIVSKKSRTPLPELATRFDIREVVADGSLSSSGIAGWKKECDSLGIAFYDVRQKGAFVMTLR